MELFFIVLEQVCIHIPFALGAYISLSLLKAPDFSLESAYVSGAFAAGNLIPYMRHLPAGISIICLVIVSLTAGALVGTLSSLLTTKGNFPHLLSGILTFGMVNGVIQATTQAYFSLPTAYNPLMALPLVQRHPELLLVALIAGACIVATYVLLKTQLGYTWAIFGNNPQFFAHYGISSTYVFMTGIIVGNALAGLSGYLFAQTSGFADLNMGSGKLLLGITMLILGKAMAIHFASRTLAIPLGGALLYFSLQQLLLTSGFNLKYFTLIQTVLVIGMLLVLFKSKLLNRRALDQLGI